MKITTTLVDGTIINGLNKIQSVKTDAERILQDVDRENLIRKLSNQITQSWFEMGLFRSCLNCEHWLEGPPDNRLQKCGKFNSRPPTKVIVCGCEFHTDNIPF